MTAPIIAGFFPDPSICRVGGTYYLANSSFQYFPGAPLHRSHDLRTWEFIGHALTRSSQLPDSGGWADGGIYAPTLRHHDGKFWLVTTNVDRVMDGQLIVTADDPAGPWSDPVYVGGAIGIDPDLAWDEAGTCYLTWASFAPGRHGIVGARVDPHAGTLLDEPRLLWPGSGLKSPEGPHLFTRGGYWYLLHAEGGTERGHTVAILRATDPLGPFEPCPDNPILTHRSTDHPVQNTGHADMVEAEDGTWSMVYLGVRPRGKTPEFHVNGRETFIAAVDWDRDWPIVREGGIEPSPLDTTFNDDFVAGIDQRWVVNGLAVDRLARTDPELGCVLTARPGEDRVMVTRARAQHWEALAQVHAPNGRGRFLVRIDADHEYRLLFDARVVTAELVIGPARQVMGSADLRTGDRLRIRVTAPTPPAPGFPTVEPDLIELGLVHADGTTTTFGTFDGRYLSTEVAGGFTGRMLGFAADDGEVQIREVHHLDHDRQPATAGNPALGRL